jgi:hypothetical protein
MQLKKPCSEHGYMYGAMVFSVQHHVYISYWLGVGVSEELAPESIRDEIIWSTYASLG